MSTQKFDLPVEARQTGKHINRALRKEKKVPAVVYGSLNTDSNKYFYLEENLVKKYYVRAYENALFTLKSSDTDLNNIVVMIKEVSVHPVNRRPQHVDLFALNLKKTVRLSLEINFSGKPLGLADGGLLNIVNRQIEIECLPTEIPEALEADVSSLGVGEALHLSDIKLPANLKLISPIDLTLAVVNLVEEEKAQAITATDAAAPAAGGAAAPAAKDAKAGAAPAAKDAKAPAGGKAPAGKAPAGKAPAGGKDKK